MKMGIWAASALAAAALAVAGPAAAQSSATGTISGFSIQLFDLDPSDGIAPELTFLYEQSNSYAQVYSNSESVYDSDWADGNWSPTSAMAMLAFGHAHAATDSSSAMAMGHVSGPGYGGEGRFYAYADGVSNAFTLTPWTGMKLTATFSGTASTGLHSGIENDYAQAYGYLSTSIYGESGGETYTAYRYASAGCGTWDAGSCSGESNSFSGTFSVSYANFSDDAVQGYMSAEAYSYGRSTVPIPEPQTYMMLLAGLAGIGAILRRRRAA